MHPDVKALHMKNHTQALADSNHRAAALMQRFGGGFASALALAYLRADSVNQAKILSAFGDLFEKYRDLTREEPDQ